MPQYIIKLTDKSTKRDYYLMWSTNVDAPVTYGLGLEDFKKWYKKEFGRQGLIELTERLERVEKTGASGEPPFDNLNDLLSLNRAGKDGKHLTQKQIIENFCINRK